jgi:hypothetical protein
MNNIKIIQDGTLFHLYIGDLSVWMNVDDLYRLMNEIDKIYRLPEGHPMRLYGLIEALKGVQEEYGGKTIDNIIQQLESRVKEHE